MPRYDLRCPCGHTWEASRSMSAPNPPCPVCARPDPEQLPATHTGFILAGRGWAADRYTKPKK